MYPANDAAVIESIEEGIATSCSLMVPCPWAPQAMKLLSQRPQVSFTKNCSRRGCRARR
ncbi:ChbG/HpnK family deacetylase [Streptomyces sp. NPDC096080]|uniref:ChbG/HpnK family deacetylase n=1 Tax=Streptomyces sp. NPDC096080 TaxID=3156693 RepID=UPI00331FC03D